MADSTGFPQIKNADADDIAAKRKALAARIAGGQAAAAQGQGQGN